MAKRSIQTLNDAYTRAFGDIRPLIREYGWETVQAWMSELARQMREIRERREM